MYSSVDWLVVFTINCCVRFLAHLCWVALPFCLSLAASYCYKLVLVVSDLTIVCRIDLNDSGEDGAGGFIPMWLYVKTIGHTAAASVNSMRQALIKEQCDALDKNRGARLVLGCESNTLSGWWGGGR
jgi:hypothetical protein